MIQVQWLTGIRPNEIIRMKPAEIDRSDNIWIYTPNSHKTQHHNKRRQIAIGPKAQAILAPYIISHAPDAMFLRVNNIPN